MKVRFAVAPGGFAFDAPRFVELVEQLEALGFDTLWLSDIPMGPSIDPVVGLGYAAAASKRLKLGANVVPFGRNPMILAKTLAQLDQLSGGRILLSLVPGIDQPNERLALGIGEQMLKEPERHARRTECIGHHGVSSPRSSPRAMRRNTSTDCRSERRPAAVSV